MPLRNSFQSALEAIQPRHAVVKSGRQGQSQVSLQGLPLHGILKIIQTAFAASTSSLQAPAQVLEGYCLL